MKSLVNLKKTPQADSKLKAEQSTATAEKEKIDLKFTRDIQFSQATVSPTFTNGHSIQALTSQIVSGAVKVSAADTTTSTTILNPAAQMPHFLNESQKEAIQKFLQLQTGIQLIQGPQQTDELTSLIHNSTLVYWLKHKLSKVWMAAFSLLVKINRKIAATRYDHKNQVELNTGVYNYNVDCSGLVNHILEQVNPKALKEIQNFSQTLEEYPKPKEAHEPWPLHYMLFLKSKDPQKPKRYWQTIENALELEPGDIIAYTPPGIASSQALSSQPGAAQKDCCSERGQHIMIVSGPIRPVRDTSWICVPIFDSTKIPHGSEDLRTKEVGGIGAGVIGLGLDSATKSPKHLLWHMNSKFILNRDIRMGRVLDRDNGGKVYKNAMKRNINES